MTMTFFLYQIAARIAALCLAVFISRTLWRGFVDGEIEYESSDWFDALFLPTFVARRDAAPVRYWIEIGFRTMGLGACLFVAIFGWWHPST